MLKNEKENRYFAGPLNLNRLKKEACTVMGTKFALSEKEFDALDMLVSREGEPVNVDLLFAAIWDTGDDVKKHKAALMSMNYIISEINEVGEGFMRIEFDPAVGYTFLTRWGRNILSADDAALSDGKPGVKRLSVTETNKMRYRFFSGSLVAIGLIALITAIAAITMLNMPATSGLYIGEHSKISEPNVPAADAPGD